MKVCFVISQLQAGGAERVVSELANYFAENNVFQVYIVTIQDREIFYSISEKVNVSNLGVKNNKNPFFNSFERISKTYKALKMISPEVVISFMTSTNIETTIASKLLKIPVIVSEQANPETSAKGVWKYLRRIIYPFSDYIVCQTTKSVEFYNNWMRRIVVIPNPIKNIEINKAAEAREKIILAVGRLSYEKGMDILIKSFDKIENCRWKLIIVGDGPEKDNLKKLIEKISVKNEVVLFGRTKQIDEIYKKASIFVLPSRSEGFSNALCEAMAHGLPCIAFNCDFGPSDIIENGVNGILVSPENAEELAKNIEILMKNREYREKLGKEAEKIKEKLSIERIMKMWDDVIKSAMENKR